MSTERDAPTVPDADATGPLFDRIVASERLPVASMALITVLFGLLITYNFVDELSTFSTTLLPVIAAAQGYLPVLGLAFGTVWLQSSGFDGIGRWRVALATYGGAFLFGATTAVTIIVRLAEGRIVGEPQYALFSTMGAGGLAGLLVGTLYARSTRTAEIAAETRDQFELMNSILRHDILNRTMVIRSRANFIADESEGRTAEFADTIVRQSDDVADQVERTRALLDALSGEERQLSAIGLRDAIDENLGAMRATHGSLTITTDVSEDIEVLADETLVDVVGNVLSNAVEHNDESEPRIEVTAEETDSYIDLRIADNGPGVPDEVKDAIFRRDETGLHEDGTGSGFGLFFVDAMLSDLGGDVWVEDNDPEGAVFVLRFRQPGLAEQ